MYKTPEEVAEWFAVSKHAVMGWADRGLLPAYIVGGTIRFLAIDVDNFAKLRPVRSQQAS